MSDVPNESRSIFIAAPLEQVYAFITDVAKLSTLSPECVRAEWNAGQSLRVSATWSCTSSLRVIPLAQKTT